MNSLLKWFSPIISNKTEKSEKMDTKNTSLRKVAIITILVVFCAVIYNLYLSNDRQFCNKSKNDLKQDLPKRQLKTDEKRPESSPEGLAAIKPKPTEFSATAQFLSEIKSLTLDDFTPINNEEAEDLKLGDVSTFNNLQLGPRIQSIVQMDYFRFVKLDLQRGCNLWPDSTKCALK